MVRNRERFMKRLLAMSKTRRPQVAPTLDSRDPKATHRQVTSMPIYLDEQPTGAYLTVIDHSGDLPYGIMSADTLAAGGSAVIGKGFPRAAQPIQEWIPGVSTPEGILLTSSAAMGLTLLLSPDLFDRVISGAATVIFVGVSTGIPAAAVWVGANLTGH